MRIAQRIFFIVVVLAASWQLGAAAYIHVKAYVAQQLLLNAWSKTLSGKEKVKPWGWSDTWPVAHLQVQRLDKEFIILAGDSGRNLAFAPGYRFGTARPGEQGLSMISAHRDTHFRFLKDIQQGDELSITTDKGKTILYVVTSTQVVNHLNAQIDLNKNNKELVLITCYPFNSINENTDLRYLVFAKETNKAI